MMLKKYDEVQAMINAQATVATVVKSDQDVEEIWWSASNDQCSSNCNKIYAVVMWHK